MIVAARTAATEPLSASLSVSLTETEKAAVRQAAETAGLSMSAWARGVVRERLR